MTLEAALAWCYRCMRDMEYPLFGRGTADAAIAPGYGTRRRCAPRSCGGLSEALVCRYAASVGTCFENDLGTTARCASEISASKRRTSSIFAIYAMIFMVVFTDFPAHSAPPPTIKNAFFLGFCPKCIARNRSSEIDWAHE